MPFKYPFLCLALYIFSQVVSANTNDAQYSPSSIKLLNQLVTDIEQTINQAKDSSASTTNKDKRQQAYTLDIPSKKIINLGLVLNYESAESGFKVLSVSPQSLAEQMGIVINDHIVSFNGRTVNESSKNVVKQLIQQASAGQHINIVYDSKQGRQESEGVLEELYVPQANLSLSFINNSVDTADSLKQVEHSINGTLWSVAHNEKQLNKNTQELSYLAEIPAKVSAYFGLELALTNKFEGFRVLSILPDATKELSAIKENDLIVSINGLYVIQMATNGLMAMLENLQPGKVVEIGVLKAYQEKIHTTTVLGSEQPTISLSVGDIRSHTPYIYQVNNNINQILNEDSSSDDSCGVVTLNRSRGLFISRIDGEGGKRDWPTYKLPIGKHTLELGALRGGKKTMVINVEANKKYYIGYFDYRDITRQDSIEVYPARINARYQKRALWLPVVWKILESKCEA